MYLNDGTLHSIARQLNLKETPTRNGMLEETIVPLILVDHCSTNNPWNFTTIGRILEKEIYTGNANTPALITPETWKQAQERRIDRKKYCPKRNSHTVYDQHTTSMHGLAEGV